MSERLRLLWWAITGNKHRKHRHDRNGMCLLPSSLPDGTMRWAFAHHLRLDHGYSLAKIAKVTGLPYKEVREYMKGELGG